MPVNIRALRVIDTGVHNGRYNVALDQALIDGRNAGTTPDTLRFLEFSSSALIGRHQDLSREVDVDYCRRHAIDVGRRITGGGAIYLDGGQLGWELICTRDSVPRGDLATVAAAICRAAATGLSTLDIDAHFRPRNDIEVSGRKISGTGGFFDGSSLFFQGTLIVTLDAGTMFAALRVPADKRERHGADVAARVTSVEQICGERMPTRAALKQALAAAIAAALDREPVAGSLSPLEATQAAHLYETMIGADEFVREIDGLDAEDGWLQASRATPGGTLRASLRCSGTRAPRIRQVLISGDYFVTPPRVIYDLECHLKDVALADVARCVDTFFATATVDAMSFTGADLSAVIEAAAARSTPAPA